MAASDQFVEQTTSAAVEEKAKLQKHFTRFDIYFFLICTIVGVDTLGQVASNGAEGFTWLLFLAVLFFVPYALLTAELGAAFTEEGGAYVWTRLAWGRFVAASTPSSTGSRTRSGSAAALGLLTLEAVNSYFFDIGTTGGFVWYVVGMAYIWFSVWSAILSFGIGKWIPTLGAWCRMVLLGLFTIAAVIYAISNGLSLPAAGDFSPTYAPLHRPRPAAVLQLRRLRAPERRRRRDGGPAARRAGHGAPRLHHGDPDVRAAHPRDRVRAAQVADHRRRWLHGLGQGRSRLGGTASRAAGRSASR